MARTKQNQRKTKKMQGSEETQREDYLNSLGEEQGTLNRKQKMRKIFRQQQKVIRQLEKKYQQGLPQQPTALQSQLSGPAAANDNHNHNNTLGEQQSDYSANLPRAEISSVMIRSSMIHAAIERINHFLPANKHKLKNSAPFISRKDSQRQVTRIKKTLSHMPFKPLKGDAEWLLPRLNFHSDPLSSAFSSTSPSVMDVEVAADARREDLSPPHHTSAFGGMTLSEELIRFSQYVSLSPAEKSSRERVLHELFEIIRIKFPQASVNAFGSYSADLSIFLSDLDVSILFPESFGNSKSKGSQPIQEGMLNRQNSFGQQGNDRINLLDVSVESVDESVSNGLTWQIDTHGFAGDVKSEGIHTENEQGKFDPVKMRETGRETDSINHIIDVSSDDEEVKERNDSYAFDESDFITEKEIMIDRDSNRDSEEDQQRTTNHLSENGNNRKQNNAPQLVEETSKTRRPLVIDDYDDDSISSSGDAETRSGSLEESVDDSNSSFVEKLGKSRLASVQDTVKNSRKLELEEDLDIQVIGIPAFSNNCSNRRFDGEIQLRQDELNAHARSLLPSEMEFSNTFQFDSDDGEFVPAANENNVSGDLFTSRRSKQVANKEHNELLGKLKSLIPVLRAMDWTSKIEFRPRAKVPIINFFHANSVECDVSIGQAAEDTSELVQYLKTLTGPALFILSAFLKVYLHQLDLDKPFTGGLGSFKLYMMIAKHIGDFYPNYYDHNQHQNAFSEPSSAASVSQECLLHKNENSSHPACSVYGQMLLSFLQFYGNNQNFNENTEVIVGNCCVSFANTRLAAEIQEAFSTAHFVLKSVGEKRLGLLKERQNYARNAESAGEQYWEEENELSLGLLSSIIHAAKLTQERKQHLKQCLMFPYREPQQRSLLAARLLPILLKRLDIAFANDEETPNLAAIEEANPLLLAKLKSYNSLERFFQVIDEQSKSLLALNLPSRDESKVRRKEYSFKHEGIVGHRIQQSMEEMTNKTRGKNSYRNIKRKRVEPSSKQDFAQDSGSYDRLMPIGISDKSVFEQDEDYVANDGDEPSERIKRRRKAGDHDDSRVMTGSNWRGESEQQDRLGSSSRVSPHSPLSRTMRNDFVPSVDPPPSFPKAEEMSAKINRLKRDIGLLKEKLRIKEEKCKI